MNLLVFDFETSYLHSDPWDPGSFVVSLGVLTAFDDMVWEGYHDWLFNHYAYTPTADISKIQEIFDQADMIIAHNISFDLKWLHKIGITLKPTTKLYDTMIAEFLLLGQTKKYGDLSLADLSNEYLETPKDDKVKMFWEAGYETDQIPRDIIMEYMKRDVLNTWELYKHQQPRIAEKGLEKLVRLQSEVAGVVCEMEENGMLVDIESCRTKQLECELKLQELTVELTMFIEEVIPELRDIPVKWSSGDHLSTILFGGTLVYDGRETTERTLKDGTIKYGERNAKLSINIEGLGFKPAKGTETKKEGYYQTDKAQMDCLKPKGKAQKRFIEMLAEISSAEKMCSTYFIPFQEESVNRLFHARFSQTNTVTGRLTCSRLHQIPRDSDSGVKSVFLSAYPSSET